MIVNHRLAPHNAPTSLPEDDLFQGNDGGTAQVERNRRGAAPVDRGTSLSSEECGEQAGCLTGHGSGGYFILFTVLALLAVTAVGFARSDVLKATGWSSTMATQAGLLAVSALIFAAIALALERIWKIAVAASLLVFVAVSAVVAFGPSPALVVAVFLLSATVLGSWVSLKLPGTTVPPLIFLTVFGVALYAIVFTLIGPLRVNFAAPHAIMLAAPLLAAVATARGRNFLYTKVKTLIWQSRHRSIDEIAGIAAFLFVAQLHLWLSALPERYADAMVFHLYLPSYVSANGTWQYDATLQAFAFAPNAVDWLYSHMFLLNGESAARLYNFAALMLLAAMIYRLAAPIASRAMAIWAATLFVSLPLAFIESSSLFIETTLALWITSAIGVLVVTNLQPDVRAVAMSLVFLAVAAMSKLHGAVAAAIIGPIVLAAFLWWRPPGSAIRQVLAVAILALAVACFPYAYAWLKTGNPVFPFYNDIFRSPYFSDERFFDRRWIGRFRWSLLYDTTFFSSKFGELANGAIGLTMFVMVPLGVAAAIVRPDKRMVVCLLPAIVLILIVGSQIQYLRYFYIFFPLILVSGAAGLLLLAQSWNRGAVLALVFMVTAFNIYKLPTAGWILRDFDLRAALSPNRYRDLEIAQAPERLANRLINERAGTSARVLYLGHPYGALLSGTALYPAWYNPTLQGEVLGVDTGAQAERLLKRWGATHVVINKRKPERVPQPLQDYLTGNLEPLAEFGTVDLYELPAAPSAR